LKTPPGIQSKVKGVGGIYKKLRNLYISKKRVYFAYRKHIELGQKCL